MMNGKPHIHNIEIRQGTYTHIKYGDTSRSISGRASEARILRNVKKVIKKHDRGSLKAEQKANRMANIQKKITLKADQWGSEQL